MSQDSSKAMDGKVKLRRFNLDEFLLFKPKLKPTLYFPLSGKIVLGHPKDQQSKEFEAGRLDCSQLKR